MRANVDSLTVLLFTAYLCRELTKHLVYTYFKSKYQTKQGRSFNAEYVHVKLAGFELQYRLKSSRKIV